MVVVKDVPTDAMKAVEKVVAADGVAAADGVVVVTARVHANGWMRKANLLRRSREPSRSKPLTPGRTATGAKPVLIARHATMTADVAVNALKMVIARNGANAQSVVAVIVPKMANALNATTSHVRRVVKAVKVVRNAEVAMAAARIARPVRTKVVSTRLVHRKSIA